MASKFPCSEDEEPEEDVSIEVQVIRGNRRLIIRRIAAIDLLDYFQPCELFTDTDREKIKCDERNEGYTAAARTFLDRLIRKRDGWFGDFLKALGHPDLHGLYEDIVQQLQKDYNDLQTKSDYGYIEETPQGKGDLAEPDTSTKTITDGEKRSSFDNTRIDLVKQKPTYRKNIALNSLSTMKDKQFDKRINVGLTEGDTGLSSHLSRALTLDEEQTNTKEICSGFDDVEVPSFCPPSSAQLPPLRNPTEHELNNLSDVPTKVKTVGEKSLSIEKEIRNTNAFKRDKITLKHTG